MAWQDNARGLLGGAQRFASGVSGLLFPGFGSAGVDPQAAQAARAQAMMQMGAGLLGGQNAGQAYGLGQAAGWEPIEQARREAVMRAAAEDRQARADDRQRQISSEEGAAAKRAQIEAELRPLLDAGDYEGASRVYARYMMPQEAKAVKDLGGMGDGGAKIGAYNPGDYTPQSFARFMQGGMKDPSVLVRQYAPPQPAAMIIGGVPSIVNKGSGQVTPLSSYDQEVAAAAGKQSAVTTATKSAESQAARVAAVEKKFTEIEDVNRVLDIATPLINIATGSAVGTAADKTAGFFGVSLDGAEAVASLKLLEANLMLRMPRMEGPQSDRDVMLYEQAAAKIGDPMVPREQKQAAVRTIRQLNARYTADKANAPAATGGQNRLRFDENGNPIR